MMQLKANSTIMYIVFTGIAYYTVTELYFSSSRVDYT